MKGIILAGGNGTRLYPVTKGVVKQLLPVYDKPMIYYPLSVLMQADITEILIISTPQDLPRFRDIFGDGSQLGLQISYQVQDNPEGLAQAFILGEKFIGDDNVALILGDNIFYGQGLEKILQDSRKTVEEEKKSVVFGYRVTDAQRYGVAEFDDSGSVISIEEKPKNPKSNYAITGLYFYTNEVIEVAKNITKSERDEYEITDVNKKFLEEKKLNLTIMNQGYAWLDTGTHESLLEASQFVSIIENRQGIKIACLEEIAYQKGYISKDDIKTLAKDLEKNQYGQYLLSLIA